MKLKACEILVALSFALGLPQFAQCAEKAGPGDKESFVQLTPQTDFRARLVATLEAAQSDVPADVPNLWSRYVDLMAWCVGLDTFAGTAPEFANADKKVRPSAIMFFNNKMVSGRDDFDPKLVDQARRYLSALETAGAFDALGELAKPCRLIPDLPPKSLDTDWKSYYSETRVVARMLRLRMIVARLDSDHKKYAETLHIRLSLARAVNFAGDPTAGVSGQLQWNSCMGDIRDDLVAGKLTREACSAVAGVLDKTTMPSMRLSYECGRIRALDVLTRVYDAADRGISPDDVPKNYWVGGQIALTRDESSLLLNRWIDAVGALLVDNPIETTKAIDTIDEIEKRCFDDNDPINQTPVLKLLPSSWGYRNRTHLALTAGVRVMLAIELYRSVKGSLPDSLEQLVPGFLPSVPDDPFNVEHRIHYTRLDAARDKLQRDYLVYSAGGDREDNQGTLSPDGNISAPIVRAKSLGSDYIINEPE